MDGNLYVISKRKLVIKVIPISDSTFVKAQHIFKTVFFDKASAENRLAELRKEKGYEKVL